MELKCIFFIISVQKYLTALFSFKTYETFLIKMKENLLQFCLETVPYLID